MKTISLSLVLSAVMLPVALHAEAPKETAAPAMDEKAPLKEGTPTDKDGKPPGRDDRDGRDKEGKDKDGKPPMRPNFDETWKKVDVNSDGFVTTEEFATMPRVAKLPEEKRTEIFKRLDKDADGKLSRQEMEQMARGGGNPMQRLKELDTDKSGGISFEEFKAGETFKKMPPEKQANVFKRLDSDGDGQITPKDQPPRRPDGPPPTPKQIIEKGDKDGDGKLSFEEFRADPHVNRLTEDEQEDRFEAMDKNKDLKLSEDEIPPMPPRPEGKPGEGKPGDARKDEQPKPAEEKPKSAPEEKPTAPPMMNQ